MTITHNYHDNRFGPIRNFPLNNSLADISASAGGALTLNTGTLLYATMGNGIVGLKSGDTDGTGLIAPADAALRITGAVSAAAIVCPIGYSGSTTTGIVGCGAPGSTASADNFLWDCGLNLNRYPTFTSEHNLGVTTGSLTTISDAACPGAPVHISWTRSSSGDVKMYLNGEQFGATATQTAPTGGGNGRLRIGKGNTNASFSGIISSVVVYDKELSSAEVLELAQWTGFAEADETAPFLTDQDPAPGAVEVPIDNSVAFRVDDADSNVVLASVVVTIDSGAGPVTVYTGSAFQSGFSGSVTPASNGYDFVINHSADWNNNQLITVRVVADDDSVFNNELDESYSFTTIEDNTPPFVTNQDPAANATGVARNTDIAFRIDDVLNSVVLSTVVITVDLGDGVVTAYDGNAGGFQTGFSGTATPASNGYDFVINPAALIDPVWTVPVRVQAEDDASVPNALDTTYYFSTRLASPTARRVRVLPLSASLRGGIETTVLSGTVLHTIDATLRNTTLPAGWSALGGVRVASRAGLRVTSTGSTAGISYDADVFYGEYAVTVLPLAPASPSTTATLAAIELLIDSSNYIATRLHRTAAARDYIQCVVALAGVLTTCAIPINAAAQHDLFVVRGPDYAYAGYGTRDRRGNWTMQRELIRAAFGIEDPAQLRVYNSNTASARFSDVRAYPVVDFAGERLIAPVYNDRGMVGTLPAATAAGGVTVTWAYDTDTATTPFTYLLPTAKTLTTESVRALKTYQDVALSDDE